MAAAAAAEIENSTSGNQTIKDLFAGAVGGATQVLIGTPLTPISSPAPTTAAR